MRGIFESLIVFGVMTGLLLPARLLFVEYVSDDWFGSLGIISAISISVIILAKKKKLGFFGPMFERQMYKFQKGKRGLLIFGESVFILLVLGGTIFAIEQGNSVYSDLKSQVTEKIPQADSHEQILELMSDVTPYEWLLSIVMFPFIFVTEFPMISALFATVDEKTDGWFLHFYTVGFVEYIEVLGILIFYRISFRKKALQPTKRSLKN